MRHVASNTGCTLFAFALAALFTAPLPGAAQTQADSEEYGASVSSPALVVFQPTHADVSIIGWEADSVHVAAERTGPIRLELEPETDGVRILERRALRDGASRPTYRLFVPRDATLRLTAQEGSITLRGLRGTVRAGIVGGSLRADSLSGSAELSTITGALEVAGFEGRLHARSVAGGVILYGVSGSIRASSTSGDVRITVAEPGVVEAESYSGRITFTGAMGRGGSSFATHSGDIVLALPERSDATLFITSVQGRPTITCGDDREPAYVEAGRPIPLGAGGPPVEIVTFSGAVTVRCGEP